MQQRKDRSDGVDKDVSQKVHEQQHTGNHEKPAKEKAGADKFGGTRKGAENVE